MSLSKKKNWIYVLWLVNFKRKLILRLSKKNLNFVRTIHQIVKACTSSMQLFVVPLNFAEFCLDVYLKSYKYICNCSSRFHRFTLNTLIIKLVQIY
jgi:hypothetical protein